MKLVIFIFLLTLVGEILGNLGLYAIWEYDSLMHFLGGIFAGSVGICSFSLLNRIIRVSDKKAVRLLLISYAIFFGLTVGALWEIGQSYNLISGHGPLSDTILDLIMDTLGGLTIGILSSKKGAKNEKFIQAETI